MLSFFHRDVLRNEIYIVTRLAVIVWPTIYVRDLTRPVSVDVLHRRCPFEGCGFPRVHFCLLAVENAAEEVEKEHNLEHTSNEGESRDEYIHILKVIEQWEVCVRVVTTWKTCQSDEVHREENPVRTDRCDPEVNITHILVKHAPEHSRIPVVNPGEHSVKGRDTHYKVEVGNYEIRIVNVDIECTVPEDDSGKTSGDEGGNESDGEQHRRVHLQVTFPQCRDPVEGFYRRWDSDQKCRKGKH